MVRGCGRTVVLMINRQANSVKRLSKNGFNLLEAVPKLCYILTRVKIIGVDQGMLHWHFNEIF